MDSSLDSVLSGQAETQQTEQTTEVEKAPEVQQETQVEVTGEQQAGSPPEAKQDDPLEKHRKGLEAAAAAERKRRQEAENEARELRKQIEQLRQPQQFQQVEDDPKPQRSQFETEDAWLDARDSWRDRQQVKAWQRQEQERAERTLKEKTESVLAEAMKLPGFDIQTFASLPVSEAAADAILDSEVAPQLVHFLTANPAEAYRIADLPKARQIKELARLEDRLKATPKEEPEPREKPRLPETLTQARDARGRFEPAYSGPTPLSDIIR